MNSPVLPEILQEVEVAWAREQKLRQKFYQDITPEHKWEFTRAKSLCAPRLANRHLMATKRLMGLMDTYVRVRQIGWCIQKRR